jgi:hypothetical protein
VPFSELVASIVPAWFSARYEIGALCAWIALATVRLRVEKRRTSPVGPWLAFSVEGPEEEGTGLG